MYLHRPQEEIVSIVFEHIPNPQDVRAVMLHGSRTDGRAIAESDYDLAIICNRVEVAHLGFYHEDVPYSCNFYPSEVVQTDKMDHRIAFSCFRAEPLFDADGTGERFVQIANSLVEESSRATEKRRREIEGYLDSLAMTAQGTGVAAAHARAKLLLHGLDMSFLYHGMPDVGRKRELEILLRDDPELFDLYVKALMPGAPFDDVQAWLDAALSEPFKADSMNWEFSTPAKIAEITVTDLFGRTRTVRDLIDARYHELKCFAETD